MIPDGDKKGTTRITKDRRNVRSMTKPGLVAPEEYSSMVGSSIKLLSFRVFLETVAIEERTTLSILGTYAYTVTKKGQIRPLRLSLEAATKAAGGLR